MGKWCLHASSFIFYWIIIKVAGNQDRHKSLVEFDLGPNQTIHFGFTCPWVTKISHFLNLSISEISCFNSVKFVSINENQSHSYWLPPWTFCFLYFWCKITSFCFVLENIFWKMEKKVYGRVSVNTLFFPPFFLKSCFYKCVWQTL